MFEYSNLKYIKDDDKEINGWYFLFENGDKYIELKIEGNHFLEILNELGKECWELVAIDELLGFVLKKRRLNNAKNN